MVPCVEICCIQEHSYSSFDVCFAANTPVAFGGIAFPWMLRAAVKLTVALVWLLIVKVNFATGGGAEGGGVDKSLHGIHEGAGVTIF